ncbi:MAG: sulfite exporter TauE/SafE family protein [Bdellovibrionota bacterium]
MLFLAPLVLFTSTFSGIFGMAGGMILMGGLLFFYTPTEAIFIQGTIQFFANFQRYYQLRSEVPIRILLFYMIGALPAYFLLRETDYAPTEKVIYIFMTFGALIASLQLHLPFSLRQRRVAVLAGLAVSALQILGITGPILDILYQDKRLSRYEVVGIKSGAMSVSHFLKVLFMYQLLGLEHIKSVVSVYELGFFLVLAFFGTWLGKYLLGKLNDKNFFKCTSFILILLAVFYLSRAILSGL